MESITQLSIQHYRAFYDRQTIEFGVPDGEQNGSGLTVLVGSNNSGKSTVVDALWFVTRNEPEPVDIEHRHEDNPFRISVSFSGGAQRSISYSNGGVTPNVEPNDSALQIADGIRTVPSRRPWIAYSQNRNFDISAYWRDARQDIREQYFLPTVVGLGEDDRKSIQCLLKKVMPEIREWSIEQSRGLIFIQYTTLAGARHASDLFGDGMSSLFRIMLALHDSEPGKLVIIDEPELSLQPQAQKRLSHVISKLAVDRQILVTTHSPYFVNWSDLANGAQISKLRQTVNGVRVGRLQDNTMRALKGLIDDWQKPHLLDTVSREMFFSDEILFVEGQEDVGLIRKFIKENEVSKDLELFGYGAAGHGNIRAFLRMAQDLGIPAAALLDGDDVSKRTAKDARKEFPDAMIEVLPTADIRDKPKRGPNGQETKEIQKIGIFDREGNIKKEYKTYFCDLIQRFTTYFMTTKSQIDAR